MFGTRCGKIVTCSPLIWADRKYIFSATDYYVGHKLGPRYIFSVPRGTDVSSYGCQDPLKFHSFMGDTINPEKQFLKFCINCDYMVVNKHDRRKKTNTPWRLSSRLLFWSPVVLFNTSIRFMCRVRAFCYSPIALYGTKWPFVVTNLLCVDTSSSSTSRASQQYSRPGFTNHKLKKVRGKPWSSNQ